MLREHARALAATDDQADRDAAAGRVLDYYLYTALAAGRPFAPRASAYRRPLPGNPSAQVPDLSTLGQSAAWLEAERANLHAAADDAATRGHSRYAVAMPSGSRKLSAAQTCREASNDVIRTSNARPRLIVRSIKRLGVAGWSVHHRASGLRFVSSRGWPGQ